MDILSYFQHIQTTKEEILQAVLGGFLISLASTLNLLLTGRITGWSSICYNAFTNPRESLYRWSNVLGLFMVSSLYTYHFGNDSHDSPNQFLGDISLRLFLFAGFLVGFGTKLGNGCTSGHGVCGLPRLSIRSIVAVCIFLFGGMAIATFRSIVPFESHGNLEYIAMSYIFQTQQFYGVVLCLTIFAILGLLFFQTFVRKDTHHTKDILVSVLVGGIFGLGLITSGMVRKTKILGFLAVDKNWDPALIFVLLSAVGFNFIAFNTIIKNYQIPLVINQKLDIPTNTVIDFKLMFGALVFGIGWGLSGLCPGPVLINLFLYVPHIVLFLVCLIIGQVVADHFGVFLDKQKFKSL